jgi:hypothetical protein
MRLLRLMSVQANAIAMPETKNEFFVFFQLVENALGVNAGNTALHVWQAASGCRDSGSRAATICRPQRVLPGGVLPPHITGRRNHQCRNTGPAAAQPVPCGSSAVTWCRRNR